MQELVFEKAWDKTISDSDRARIIEIFQEAVLSDMPEIQFSPLWQAINHKGERLITVIIHNQRGDVLSITNQTLQHKTGEIIAARHNFSLPFVIKAKTSMPWTFIFPSESIFTDKLIESGKIEIAKSYDPE